MPIFFNIESHIWIIYLFIINGLMFTWLLRAKSKSFRSLTNPFESQLLSAFFISLGINGLILLVLDWLSLDFSQAKWALAFLSGSLIFSLYVIVIRPRECGVFRFDANVMRLALYLFVFVILFYNGGLIEKISDAWWHMSLANKIALDSSYSLEIGHLVGLPTRYYPPLWHGNLALATQLSEISIPVYWNSMTAWVGAFKVMAFYLFAFGISKSRQLAVLAAVLFVLLPGMGVSYLRVSAWPAHVAYTAWYAMFYVVALMFDELPDKDKSLGQGVLSFFAQSTSKLLTLAALCILIWFTHKAEILWFGIAWFAYLIAASLSRVISNDDVYIGERDHYLLRYLYRGGLSLIIVFGLWFAASENALKSISDESLAYLLPVVLASILFLIDMPIRRKAISWGLTLVFFVLVLGSVNYTHLYSLFKPEFALAKGAAHESSAVAIGYLGGELNAPSWHLQLRSGLLYTGILSILLAIVALILKPSRMSILIAGTGALAVTFCISPYLYHWLQAVLNYHSTWRVSLIIFHPITWALILVTLFDFRKRLGVLDR